MKYTRSFQVVGPLNDGPRLSIRAVRPSGKAALAQGIARLSVESRRQQLNAAKSEPTNRTLRLPTERDGPKTWVRLTNDVIVHKVD